MKKKKQKELGLGSVRRASVAILAFFAISFAIPVVAFAQFDAGAVAATEVAPDTAPAVAPTAEAPAEAVTPAPEAIAPAPADVAPAPSETRTSLDKLSSEVLNILIPIFVLLAGALGTALLNWLRKRFKLDVSDKQIYQWSLVAEMAASRGAEWARNKAKSLAENQTVPGPEIMDVAANWAIDYGIAHGLPEMGREKLEGLIESKLNVKRTPIT